MGCLGAFPIPGAGGQLAANHHSASAGAGKGSLLALQKPFAAALSIQAPKKLPLLCSHGEGSAWSLPCSPGTCCPWHPTKAVPHPTAWSQPGLPRIPGGIWEGP